MAPNSLPLARSASPKLKALSASSEEVVASSTGASNFCTEASDSPSLPRKFEAALPTAPSTCSFLSAWTCSRAKLSPVRQFHRIHVHHILGPDATDSPVQHGL